MENKFKLLILLFTINTFVLSQNPDTLIIERIRLNRPIPWLSNQDSLVMDSILNHFHYNDFNFKLRNTHEYPKKYIIKTFAHLNSKKFLEFLDFLSQNYVQYSGWDSYPKSNLDSSFDIELLDPFIRKTLAIYILESKYITKCDYFKHPIFGYDNIRFNMILGSLFRECLTLIENNLKNSNLTECTKFNLEFILNNQNK